MLPFIEQFLCSGIALSTLQQHYEESSMYDLHFTMRKEFQRGPDYIVSDGDDLGWSDSKVARFSA